MKSQKRFRARVRERGVTLVEMLIVVSIMALVSAVVALGAFKYFGQARVRAAETDARTLRQAVMGYWTTHDDSVCPTIDQLVAAGILDEAAERKDPWGSAWRIQCSETRVTVSSDGPDRHSGTADDIRVPPKTT